MEIKKYYLVAFVLFLPILISFNSGEGKATSNTSDPVALTANLDTGFIVPPVKQVCMINNRFMHTDQFPVPVNGKMYYGCCENCKKTLNENAASRSAIDPLTSEKVDKAIAFIIIKPGTKDDVLYFKSEANARDYTNKSHNH